MIPSTLEEIVLTVIALLAGISTGMVGAGGVLLVVALTLNPTFSPAEVAGTASAVFIPGSILGVVSYSYSDDLDWVPALFLGATSLLGILVGVRFNIHVSDSVFNLILGILVILMGYYLFVSQRREVGGRTITQGGWPPSWAVLAIIGIIVGIFGGLLGISGPLVAVPLLIVVGAPILTAVGVAMAQAIFITSFTTLNYFYVGTIQIDLLPLLATGFAVGIVAGWRIAHLAETFQLMDFLSAVLVLSGAYSILQIF